MMGVACFLPCKLVICTSTPTYCPTLSKCIHDQNNYAHDAGSATYHPDKLTYCWPCGGHADSRGGEIGQLALLIVAVMSTRE